MRWNGVSRAQALRICSNTGAVSATDWLIAPRTSADAACCASASLVSLNRRTFSMAITAWSAKVWSSSIWCALNSPASTRVTLIMPMATPSRTSGTFAIERKPRARARSRCRSVARESLSTSAIWMGSPVRSGDSANCSSTTRPSPKRRRTPSAASPAWV